MSQLDEYVIRSTHNASFRMATIDLRPLMEALEEVVALKEAAASCMEPFLDNPVDFSSWVRIEKADVSAVGASEGCLVFQPSDSLLKLMIALRAGKVDFDGAKRLI